MQANYRDTKNMNVEMPISAYEAIKRYMDEKRIHTNLSFLLQAIQIERAEYVNVNFLAIDGGDAASHSAILQVGECVYRWSRNTFILVPQMEALQLIYSGGVSRW